MTSELRTSDSCTCQTVSDEYSDHRFECPVYVAGKAARIARTAGTKRPETSNTKLPKYCCTEEYGCNLVPGEYYLARDADAEIEGLQAYNAKLVKRELQLGVALHAVIEVVQKGSPQWLLADQLIRMLEAPRGAVETTDNAPRRKPGQHTYWCNVNNSSSASDHSCDCVATQERAALKAFAQRCVKCGEAYKPCPTEDYPDQLVHICGSSGKNV